MGKKVHIRFHGVSFVVTGTLLPCTDGCGSTFSLSAVSLDGQNVTDFLAHSCIDDRPVLSILSEQALNELIAGIKR